jgi:hypothetical protein
MKEMEVYFLIPNVSSSFNPNRGGTMELYFSI